MVQQRNEAPIDLCTRDQDKENITIMGWKKTNNAKEGKTSRQQMVNKTPEPVYTESACKQNMVVLLQESKNDADHHRN
ncbi:hypothetical protein Hanom_Chr03g00270021 [Helianthus anomalus]